MSEAAGGLTGLFAVAAVAGWYAVRRQMRERPALLAATRDELERDQAALGRNAGQNSGRSSSQRFGEGPGEGPGEGL
jgi:hypothetical protein